MKYSFFLTVLALGAKANVLFTSKDSARCRKICIDRNAYFCPGNDETQEVGFCCDSFDCPKQDFCSFNAPLNSPGLVNWACPYERAKCGDTQILIPYNPLPGQPASFFAKQVLTNQGVFGQGSMCKYKINFPSTASRDDTITFTVNKLVGATVVAVETIAYTAKNFREVTVPLNGKFSASQPNTIYLSILSDYTSTQSSFEIVYNILSTTSSDTATVVKTLNGTSTERVSAETIA